MDDDTWEPPLLERWFLCLACQTKGMSWENRHIGQPPTIKTNCLRPKWMTILGSLHCNYETITLGYIHAMRSWLWDSTKSHYIWFIKGALIFSKFKIWLRYLACCYEDPPLNFCLGGIIKYTKYSINHKCQSDWTRPLYHPDTTPEERGIELKMKTKSSWHEYEQTPVDISCSDGV